MIFHSLHFLRCTNLTHHYCPIVLLTQLTQPLWLLKVTSRAPISTSTHHQLTCIYVNTNLKGKTTFCGCCCCCCQCYYRKNKFKRVHIKFLNCVSSNRSPTTSSVQYCVVPDVSACSVRVPYGRLSLHIPPT